MKNKIFIFGGSGFVGKNLIEKLVQDDYQIKVLTRTEKEKDFLEKFGVKIIIGDVLELNSFLDQLEENSIIFYLIHGLSPQKVKNSLFNIEEKAVRNLIKAAEIKKAAQIIHLTGIYFEDQKLSLHLLSRKQTLEAIKNSATPHTILRTSIIFGKKSASFEIIKNTLLKLSLIPLFAWRDSRVSPIHIDDVTSALIKTMDDENFFNQMIDICGNQTFTYEQLLKQVAQFLRIKRIFIKIPFNLFYLPSFLISLITDISRKEIYFLLRSLKNDCFCQKNQLEKLFAIKPRSIFDKNLFYTK